VPQRQAPESIRDLQAWARGYILSTELDYKLAPPTMPREELEAQAAERLAAPGRPAQLKPAERRERSPRPEALGDRRLRAKLFHAFFHHELQAAELMCWAFLAFPETPRAFRVGLMRICQDEIRHMNLYRDHLHTLGYTVGDFPVRDWFWKRVPLCQDATAFVALMGMGLEGANLDIAPAFAERFRAAGDEAGALLQERVAKEEIAHVRFATHWFSAWVGALEFDAWVEHLPPPLSPLLMRGNRVAHEARVSAGMHPAFVEALCRYVPEPRGRSSAALGRAKQ
jgi:uncharacterized ferritin-like protein (DUF455 family)